MALRLVPLYGLSCAGEPLPGASPEECAEAVASVQALKAAMERAPAPDLAPDGPSGPAPGERPEFEPGGPGMSFGR